MCNHYRSLPGAIEWVQRFIPGVTVPTEFPDFKVEMFPKYLGPVVIRAEGKREMRTMRWGVWPYYADKPQFITNARCDGLLKKPICKQSARHRR